MNQILSYIKKHDLYSDNDKRYISVNKPESNKILSLFDIQTTETLFRIQHFRKFLETNIKNNLKKFDIFYIKYIITKNDKTNSILR